MRQLPSRIPPDAELPWRSFRPFHTREKRHGPISTLQFLWRDFDLSAQTQTQHGNGAASLVCVRARGRTSGSIAQFPFGGSRICLSLGQSSRSKVTVSVQFVCSASAKIGTDFTAGSSRSMTQSRDDPCGISDRMFTRRRPHRTPTMDLCE